MKASSVVKMFSAGDSSPALKQIPSVLVLILGFIALYVTGGQIQTGLRGLWAGTFLVLIATGLSLFLPWARLRPNVVVIVPILTLLGFGLFRAGTGGGGSMFGAILLIPLVWIASEDGRRNIAFAAGTGLIALLMPYLVRNTPWDDGQLLRSFFSPLVYLVIATVVNDLAHRVRRQLSSARALAEERAGRLHEAEAHADELERGRVQLAASEAFSRSVWDAIEDEIVMVTDERGTIVAWNPGAEKFLGATASETEGRAFVLDFFDRAQILDRATRVKPPIDPFNDRDQFVVLVEKAYEIFGPTAEWTLVGVAGAAIPAQVSVAVRMNPDGSRAGFIFVGTDQTQAHEVSRLKDEFVGMVSHELRTPLSSILGYLELIRDDDEAPLTQEQLSYLGVAERNAHRLLKLVGDLLFTAQVEAGKFPLEVRPYDFRQAARSSVESSRPQAERAGIAVLLRVPDDPVLVSGDAVRLSQACDNLISNALKFTGSGGTIDVAVSVQGGEAVMAVSDTGMGIPAAEIDRLFTRFFRASTATRQAVQGVGLGLSITKAIVTAHHGRLDVESVEGEGTTFSITIPLAAGTGSISATEGTL